MEENVDIHSSEFDIRYMEASDAPLLKEWLSLPEVRKWFPFSEDKEVDQAVQIWSGFSKYRCCLTADWKHEPCGMGILYLMPYRKVAHHCLTNFVVPPSMQHQGIGGALLKNLKHLAKSYFRLEWIQIEVMADSPVIALLKKHAFTEFARQEMYFKREEGFIARVLMEADLRDGKK